MGDDGWHSHLQVFAINLCVLCTCLYVLLLRILCVYINSCTSIYIIFRTMHEKCTNIYHYILLCTSIYVIFRIVHIIIFVTTYIYMFICCVLVPCNVCTCTECISLVISRLAPKSTSRIPMVTPRRTSRANEETPPSLSCC